MYHFTDLPPGSKELVAEIAGMGEKTLPVKPGSTTIDLPKK